MTDIFTLWLKEHAPEIDRIHTDEKARLAQEERIAKETAREKQRRQLAYYTNILERLCALTTMFILSPERSNADKAHVILYMRNIRNWTAPAHPQNQPAIGVNKAHEFMHEMLNGLSDDCSFFVSQVESLLDQAAHATEADLYDREQLFSKTIMLGGQT